MADEEVFAYRTSEAFHFEAQKKETEKLMCEHAKKDRWQRRKEAVRYRDHDGVCDRRRSPSILALPFVKRSAS